MEGTHDFPGHPLEKLHLGTRANLRPSWLLLRRALCSQGPCAGQTPPSAGERGHHTRPTESSRKKSPSGPGLRPIVPGAIGWDFQVLSLETVGARRDPAESSGQGHRDPELALTCLSPWLQALPLWACSPHLSAAWAGDLADLTGPACPSHRLSETGRLRAPGSRHERAPWATLGQSWLPD